MSTATRPRGRPRDEAINSAILQAAVDEMVDRGLQAASMEAIAERAGVAKTTLYRRWSNLEDLVQAAIQTFEEPVDRPPEGSVRTQLLWLLEIMRRKWGDPTYAAVMRRAVAEAVSDPAKYRRVRDRVIGPYIRVMNAVLRRGMDEGVLRTGVDVEWIRQMLVSPIMANALTLKDRVSRDQLELTVDTVLAGLAPRAQ